MNYYYNKQFPRSNSSLTCHKGSVPLQLKIIFYSQFKSIRQKKKKKKDSNKRIVFFFLNSNKRIVILTCIPLSHK